MRRFCALLALCAAFACSEDPTAPSGTVLVQITTSGIDQDLGYILDPNGFPSTFVPVSGSVVVNNLPPGTHVVRLNGIAANCSVTGGNHRTVDVGSGSETEIRFDVVCVGVTGVIEVTAVTTGENLDPNGFSVQDGSAPAMALGINGITVLEAMGPGQHTLLMSDVASNCTVGPPNPRSVQVNVGSVVRDTARVVFSVSCIGPRGDLRVFTETSGLSLDPDGYSVTRDGADFIASIPANGSAVVSSLVPGPYSLRLDGVAPNCNVVGANPRVAQVTHGTTNDVTFEVTCTGITGGLRVITQTSGGDLDTDGYSLSNASSGATILSNVPVNGSSATVQILQGTYSLLLGGLAANCAVIGANPRPVAVVANTTTDVAFAVGCVASTHFAVSAQTTGPDPDANGYRIRASGSGVSAEGTVSANGAALIGPLPFGTYTLTLTDLATNCEVNGLDAGTITTTGPVTPVAFTVTCTPLQMIAFVSTQAQAGNSDIYIARADGSGVQRLTTVTGSDIEPAWSAATGRIAFVSERDGNFEIYAMNADGSGQIRLTTNSARDYTPSWSPDGTRIAFASERDGNLEIYVMNADGSNVQRLTHAVDTDTDPAWSPDGQAIAFSRRSCVNTCIGGIYVMTTIGTGITRLTQGFSDGQPAWSPDGGKIAFARLNTCGYYACEYNIAVVPASGGVVTPLFGDEMDENSPSWSPNGSRLLVSVGTCDYYQCTPTGIRAVRHDGRDPIVIIAGPAYSAVWRR